jgi:tRNA(fMet)-specific endonuclease VapC
VNHFLLDTNTISYIARNRSPNARKRFKEAETIAPVYISVISEAEALYGFAKRPEALQASHAMREILAQLTILPWTSEAANAYGILRARNEVRGVSLGGLDMLIAAHALAADAILVTSDAAFARLSGGPATVNWADDVKAN